MTYKLYNQIPWIVQKFFFNFLINKVSEFVKFLFLQYCAFWALLQKKTLDDKIHCYNVFPDIFCTSGTIFFLSIKRRQVLDCRLLYVSLSQYAVLNKIILWWSCIRFPPIACFVNRNSRGRAPGWFSG